MITKEKFVSLILRHQKWMNRINEISDTLNISTLWECDWVNYTVTLFNKTITSFFKEEGIEDIEWWLYEKSGNPELKIFDTDGSEIPTETIDDLWEIVKGNCK